jgi:ssDNA-binding Zn-finger/Zn-ribbon topoisomerase 1
MSDPTPLLCPECGAPMVLRTTTKHYYGNGQPRKFYGCTRYPECGGAHGAHPNGEPIGIPADAETKRARMAAHDAFDRLWKGELGGTMTRKQAYRELQRVMGMTEEQAHIGRMDKQQCARLVELLGETEVRK